MRPGSDQLAEVLTGSFSVRLIADVFYGAERVYKDLPIASNWSLKWDVEARIKASGTLLVEYSSEVADSLTPVEFTDLLAPFGTELNLLLEVSAGTFSETLTLGRYVLTKVPNARDENMRVLGRTLTTGSLVELELQDSLVRLQRRGFDGESQPPTGATRWEEIGRLSGFQLTRNTGDATVPAGVLYEPKQGGRLEAIQDHAAALGGRPYMSPDNTLTIASYDIGDEPVLTLRIGERGTVIDAKYSMDSEDVFNEVIGTYDVTIAGQRTTLTSVARVETGRLVPSDLFWNTYYHQSSAPQSQYEADLETKSILDAKLSSLSYRVPVTCILDPRITFVDVVAVELPTRTIHGRVMNYSFGTDGLMQLEIEVKRVLR